MKLTYYPSCTSVGCLVGRSVDLSVIISSFTSHAPIGALVLYIKDTKQLKKAYPNVFISALMNIKLDKSFKIEKS